MTSVARNAGGSREAVQPRAHLAQERASSEETLEARLERGPAEAAAVADGALVKYPIVPVPKPRMTRRDKWAKRPCVLRYRAFKDQVKARRVELPQPCRVVFWIAMPRSWSEAEKRAHEGQPHQQTPDLDNLVKALGDAVLTDDRKLWSIRAEKRWARVGAIEIEPITEGS